MCPLLFFFGVLSVFCRATNTNWVGGKAPGSTDHVSLGAADKKDYCLNKVRGVYIAASLLAAMSLFVFLSFISVTSFISTFQEYSSWLSLQDTQCVCAHTPAHARIHMGACTHNAPSSVRNAVVMRIQLGVKHVTEYVLPHYSSVCETFETVCILLRCVLYRARWGLRPSPLATVWKSKLTRIPAR